MIPTSWSPDGAHLLVDHGDPGETEIWVIDMHGEPNPRPVVQTRPWVSQGAFSPDGRWVAYASREEGENDVVFIVDFPDAGRKIKMTSGRSSSPMWQPDMQHLFFEADGLKEIDYRVDAGRIRFGVPKALFDFADDSSVFVQSGKSYCPSPDGRFVVFAASDEPSEITALTLVIGWDSELDRH